MTFKDEYGPAFRKAWAFFEKHSGSSAEADWERAQEDALAFKTEFEKDLALAAMGEIERRMNGT